MTRQQTRPEVAEQRTLTDSIDEPTDDCDASDSAPTTQAALLGRARTHAADVAAEHFPTCPVESID
ncbi:hypothetical protein [Halomicrococcus sp. NG-SE-24]|uniref:hypothetical protein n=1 Tax=Halomicrococcus sp. NG-SE-24 TaxID=3436928 RepID=UPI003D97B90E